MPDKIMIMLPNWFFNFFSWFLRESFNRDEFHHLKQRFEGIKTQPHYADEIVVFFEDYHFNPDRFASKTHIIKFETTEIRKEH